MISYETIKIFDQLIPKIRNEFSIFFKDMSYCYGSIGLLIPKIRKEFR